MKNKTTPKQKPIKAITAYGIYRNSGIPDHSWLTGKYDLYKTKKDAVLNCSNRVDYRIVKVYICEDVS